MGIVVRLFSAVAMVLVPGSGLPYRTIQLYSCVGKCAAAPSSSHPDLRRSAFLNCHPGETSSAAKRTPVSVPALAIHLLGAYLQNPEMLGLPMTSMG